MKIDISINGELVVKEIYDAIILETADGNQLAICMRDDTFELSVVGSDMPHRVNVETGSIDEV